MPTPDDEIQLGWGMTFPRDRRERPAQCTSMQVSLLAALECGDVPTAREILRDGKSCLEHFTGSELAGFLGAAIASGDTAKELLDALLQAGVPAQCVRDKLGVAYQSTPLVSAAKEGRLDLVQKLVDAGADVFWSSPTGANALSEIHPSRACQDRFVDTPDVARVREWLVSQGLRIDPTCADSRRKLGWASGDPDGWQDVPGLLELGVPIEETGWTPFMLDLALGRARVEQVARLGPEELKHTDGWARTPFLLAVAAGDVGIARALVERGCDMEAVGHCGATALRLAAKYDRVEMIRWLVGEGVTVDAVHLFGRTALESAVSSNSLGAAALLIELGANVKVRDPQNYGLIHGVPFGRTLGMLKLLLAAGLEVNDVSGGGSWPLHDSCEAGNAEAVRFLLEHGADPNLTSTGETALFAAVAKDSLECVRLLLDAGAQVNALDVDGWTCLFRLRSEAVARYLLANGADPGLRAQIGGGLPEDWEDIPKAVREMLRVRRCELEQSSK
jgi:ankyrin repeat protein